MSTGNLDDATGSIDDVLFLAFLPLHAASIFTFQLLSLLMNVYGHLGYDLTVHRRYSPLCLLKRRAFSLASLPHRIFEYGLVARLTAALSTGNLDDATGSIDDVHLTPRNWAFHRVFRWVNTTRNHHGHHQRFNGNFGLYTTLWDRLFGTYRELGEVAPFQQKLEPTTLTALC